MSVTLCPHVGQSRVFNISSKIALMSLDTVDLWTSNALAIRAREPHLVWLMMDHHKVASSVKASDTK